MRKEKKILKMLRYICLSFVIVFGLMTIVGTGGGGGDGDNGNGDGGGDNLTLDDLVGTYSLSAFTVTYQDGTSVTQDDASTYSGTMVIEPDGDMTQTMEISGYSGTTSGKILSVGNDTMRVSSSGCEYDVGINLSGDVLTTTLPLGTCGIDYSEVDVWIKTRSDFEASVNNDVDKVIDDDSDQTIIGSGIGNLYQLLP